MNPQAAHPYLTLPLTGVQSIEASAGTGKTFTLATLVLRLLVERKLGIGEILAVTFTEAATQELRARIRARLTLAVAMLDGERDDDPSSEAHITRAVLDACRESPDALRQRLREAIDGIDLAAVFTIHGFCARVLREHALESGQGFDTPELLASDAALREEIATDLWRAHGVSRGGADDLLALWPGGPDMLAADLSPLVREPVLRPEPTPLPSDPFPELHIVAERLIAAVREHGEDFRQAVLSAMTGKVLNGQSFKAVWVNELFDQLLDWAAQGKPELLFEQDHLERLGRAYLASKTNKGKDASRPDSPLSDAVDDYVEARAAVQTYLEARRVHRLHAVRDDARVRLARRKQQLRVQTYDDLIDRVADALASPRAALLAGNLRRQYRMALVDEFQDTDSRQWQIFDRVFGTASDEPALFLIGDPKQAIYGFRGGDIDTYLAAIGTAIQAPPLDQNFRSRPCVLAAVQALYEAAGDHAFVVDGITFHPVQPGGVRGDDDHLRQGRPAPALTIWQAPPPLPDDQGKRKPHSAEHARELVTDACVAEIHRLLSAARAGEATIGDRPLQPGDIAVLVRKHHEATRIRQALAAVGIAAVAAGQLSLFVTDEARELHALLLALLHGADDGRLRMALATVLLGVDAAGIAALDADSDALHRSRLRMLEWRERLQSGGVLALVNDLCAEQATRLLGMLDGERRLTNYLQLAELLQQAQAHTLGLPGLIDWLVRAIADGNGNDEAQLLRLESDARRVQVVTLHKSKGLEYPLVFLPYAGIGGKPPSVGRHIAMAGDEGRILHWRPQIETPGWDDAHTRWKKSQRAEDARLLYVGLTRASHALWLATGAFYNHNATALAPMLANGAALAEVDSIRIDTHPPEQHLPWLPPEIEGETLPPRQAKRVLHADWWIYSFTQLAHADAGHDVMAAATEQTSAAADEPAHDIEDTDGSIGGHDPRFTGSRFGNVLHAALEAVDFAAWARWREGGPAPEGQHSMLREALRGEGYAGNDLDDGLALLTTLVGRTLVVALPEGGALHSLPAQERRAEIEFHFALQATVVSTLIGLLHEYGIARERRGFGLRRRLEGLMTGKIDLTYVRDGRWYVLDYKSNRLPRYDAPAMVAAMAHSEYDLQALIYTLALHRWLRFRLGDEYDYERDFGGIRYLFCRGLDAERNDGSGVHAHRYPAELVHALDALFAGRTREVAA